MASKLLPQMLLESFCTVVYTLDLFLIFLTPPDALSSVEQVYLWSDIVIHYEWTVLCEGSEWLVGTPTCQRISLYPALLHDPSPSLRYSGGPFQGPTCQRIFLYSALSHNPSLSLFATQADLFRGPTSGSH